MNLNKVYNFFTIKSDSIAKEWPLISSPYPIICFTLGYLSIIYIVGPLYMKNKPPYRLKKIMLFYNIIQIIANAWIIKEHIRGGWMTKYFFICRELNDSDTSNSIIINMVWWILILKTFDYVETFIFVLRKKQNQVSILHVYHHITVISLNWLWLKYVVDARATYISLINCTVHVIMYTYYSLTTCGSKFQRTIAIIKPYITMMQMIQFCIILIVLLQLIFPHCNTTENEKKLLPYLVLNVSIYFILFYNFYKKNYTKTPKQKC